MGSPGLEGMRKLPGKRIAVRCRAGVVSVENTCCCSAHGGVFRVQHLDLSQGPVTAACLCRWGPETTQVAVVGHEGFCLAVSPKKYLVLCRGRKIQGQLQRGRGKT